ncbi:MAG: hypothetical protein SynsKO_22120 [Synoicihabitans sp.]
MKSRRKVSTDRKRRENKTGTQEIRREWQTPEDLYKGAVRKTASPHCKVEGSLRGKRSDPCHGANAQPKAGADPVKKVAMCE